MIEYLKASGYKEDDNSLKVRMRKHLGFVDKVKRTAKGQILCVGHCHAFKMIYSYGLRNCELKCVDKFYEGKKKDKGDLGPKPDLEIELRLGLH